jgi:hypothetical protein
VITLVIPIFLVIKAFKKSPFNVANRTFKPRFFRRSI